MNEGDKKSNLKELLDIVPAEYQLFKLTLEDQSKASKSEEGEKYVKDIIQEWTSGDQVKKMLESLGAIIEK